MIPKPPHSTLTAKSPKAITLRFGTILLLLLLVTTSVGPSTIAPHEVVDSSWHCGAVLTFKEKGYSTMLIPTKTPKNSRVRRADFWGPSLQLLAFSFRCLASSLHVWYQYSVFGFQFQLFGPVFGSFRGPLWGQNGSTNAKMVQEGPQ